MLSKRGLSVRPCCPIDPCNTFCRLTTMHLVIWGFLHLLLGRESEKSYGEQGLLRSLCSHVIPSQGMLEEKI